MTRVRFVHGGEVFIALPEVLVCYALRRERLEDWIAAGLVESPREIEGVPALPAAMLDRIAALVRLAHLLDADTDFLAAFDAAGFLPKGSIDTIEI